MLHATGDVFSPTEGTFQPYRNFFLNFSYSQRRNFPHHVGLFLIVFPFTRPEFTPIVFKRNCSSKDLKQCPLGWETSTLTPRPSTHVNPSVSRQITFKYFAENWYTRLIYGQTMLYWRIFWLDHFWRGQRPNKKHCLNDAWALGRALPIIRAQKIPQNTRI